VRIGRRGGLLAVGTAAMLIAGCGSNNNNGAPGGTPSSGSTQAAGCAGGTLSGAGSTFQQPMELKWIAQFTAQCSNAQIDYTGDGSGAGVSLFSSGTQTFAGDDVILTSKDRPGADGRCHSLALDIPVAAGGVALTWNLPTVHSLKLSPDTIAGIFDGSITTWNASALTQDNPGVALPSTHISVFYRSDASGTTAVFTGFLKDAATNWALGSGKTVNFPVGQGAAQSAGVSAGVASTTGGITYVEQNYATAHNLPTAQVKNAGGSYVALNAANVSTGLASLTVAPAGPDDLSAKLNFRPTDPNAYPISTVTYVITCTTYPSSVSAGTVALLKDYLTYAVTTGQQYATGLGFAPLPSTLVTRDTATIAAIS